MFSLSSIWSKVSAGLAVALGILVAALKIQSSRVVRTKDKLKHAEETIERKETVVRHQKKVEEVLQESLKNETSRPRRGYFDNL